MSFLSFTKKKIIVSLIVFLGTLFAPIGLDFSIFGGGTSTVKLWEIYLFFLSLIPAAVSSLPSSPSYIISLLFAFLVPVFLIYFIVSLIMHFLDKR